MSRYFEDIRLGEQIEIGSYLFTQENIIDFARQFDPQPFHIDAEQAAQSHFGGLIASGWHTASVWMKLMIAYQDKQARERNIPQQGERPQFGPSPGFRDMKWLAPVRAGDTISYKSRVVEKIELQSRPNWGLLVSRNEGANQNGCCVFSFLGQVFIARRPG